MYTKRVQITNYGPIDQLDIDFPFEGDAPKPVLLVGENGSGKSILLSHIVNGLVSAKDAVYPDTPEVETDRVYKLRSSLYIKSGREFSFAKVGFEDELFIEELRSRRPKPKGSSTLDGLSEGSAKDAWQKMQVEKNDHFDSNFFAPNEDKIKTLFSRNCVLYFPPNRFEEPAWLNEENLKATANYMELKNVVGQTSRKVINYSPLHDNQNWLFDVIYDQTAFELQTHNLPLSINEKNQLIRFPVFGGYSGKATSVYEIALQIVRGVINENENTRFGIGERHNRVVSIMEGKKQLVPNIFQLSSGETSLLNLFLSILRDFDLSGTTFTKAEEIRGIVVVDEIELHLHAVHQHKILPRLIKMFPRVQFVVTTHSPLFVLGMKNTFGEDGFALYRLPQGHQISPEEFSEFGSAYETFTETKRFSDDIRAEIENARKPVVFLDGLTNQRYIEKAAELLNQQELLVKLELKNGEDDGKLKNIWKGYNSKLAELIPQKVVLLHDCDSKVELQNRGNIFKRKIPHQNEHPVKKGIENLFSRTTLERAMSDKPAFLHIKCERKELNRGKEITIPEEWAVHPDEKTNLCDWLCENGTADDFQHFQEIFDLLEEILDVVPTVSTEQSQQQE